jgi:hypothetical protein
MSPGRRSGHPTRDSLSLSLSLWRGSREKQRGKSSASRRRFLEAEAALAVINKENTGHAKASETDQTRNWSAPARADISPDKYRDRGGGGLLAKDFFLSPVEGTSRAVCCAASSASGGFLVSLSVAGQSMLGAGSLTYEGPRVREGGRRFDHGEGVWWEVVDELRERPVHSSDRTTASQAWAVTAVRKRLT